MLVAAGLLMTLAAFGLVALSRRVRHAQADAVAAQARAVAAEAQLQAQDARLADLRLQAEAERQRQAQRIEALEQQLLAARSAAELRAQETAQAREALLADLSAARGELRELRALHDSQQAQAQEKLALLVEAREQLGAQFKALASELLEEKSRRFAEQNQENLGQLLNPLRERISAFQSKVEEVYVAETRERSALAEQVRMLTQLNNTLSQDTQNLTLALKGDRKAQGNFGEIILDDVLEKAGLCEGQHYVRQGGVGNAEGQGTSIPDVVIRLPGERFLVVDSKMSLPDYRAFADASDEAERTAALRRHLGSLRNHIKGLSEKKYQTLYDLKSLDFVVMFVPLEPAFTLAVTNDGELFQHAWERNVLLVSPSTLLFVVRTVANLWRQEDLSRNAKDISAQGAKLYDKLVGFVADLDEIGKRLEQAQDSYGDARRKLREGPGNLVGQAEKLRKLGIKPSKPLPAAWTETLGDDAALAAPVAEAGGDQPK